MCNASETTTANDRDLMRRIARERDASAFDTLSDRYRESLRRFLLSRLDGNSAIADDLLQETLLRLWTRAESYDGRGPVKAWLFRIAIHLAQNQRRTIARRREDPLLPETDDDMPAHLADVTALAPEEAVLRADASARFRRLLSELPEETRELLRHAHEEEQSLRQVAGALGIPEGTVKSRLFHARKRIARAWLEEEGE